MNKYVNSDDCSYCLGMSLTIELIKHASKYAKKVILSNKAFKNEQLSLLLSLCDEQNVEVIYDDEIIDKLSLKENCYCIGVFNKFENDLVGKNHIVLYKFNDFGEMGTILRSCISFNFKDIVLIDSDIDYFDPRCIRASMGAIFHTNIKKYKSLDEYFKEYENQNVYPFISNGQIELNEMKLNEPYSIIIPQLYNGLDTIYEKGYYIKHNNLSDMSLSIKSSLIIHKAYNQNLKR